MSEVAICLEHVPYAIIQKRAKSRGKRVASLCLRFCTDMVGKVVGSVLACDLIHKERLANNFAVCNADVEANADFERLEDEHAIGPRA